MRAPRVTFEQIIRPLLAIVFIIGFSGAVHARQAEAAPTTVSYYELPASVTDARQLCFEQAAEEHGIPSGTDAYVQWWNTNKGTAVQREWTTAFEACKTAHPMPGGKWNWAGMTLVRTEVWS